MQNLVPRVFWLLISGATLTKKPEDFGYEIAPCNVPLLELPVENKKGEKEGRDRGVDCFVLWSYLI